MPAVRRLWFSPLLLAAASACSPGGSPEPAALIPQAGGPGRAEDHFRKAEAIGRDGNLAGALIYLSDALRSEPTHRQALDRTVEYALTLGRQKEAQDPNRANELYTRARDAARTLRETYPGLTDEEREWSAMARYAEARLLARDGKTEEALAAMKGAVEDGLAEAELVEFDPNMESIRRLEGFPAVLAAARANADRKAQKQARALLAETKPEPFSFELPDLERQTVRLDDLRGKVTIVDIWGTWCPPCREELPHLAQLYEEYRDRGLQIVGVTFENPPLLEAAIPQIKAFLADNKVPYPLVVGNEATMEKLGPHFGGFPTTLFLDSAGHVRAKLVGYHPRRDLESLVTALLEEEAPPAAGSGAE